MVPLGHTSLTFNSEAWDAGSVVPLMDTWRNALSQGLGLRGFSVPKDSVLFLVGGVQGGEAPLSCVRGCINMSNV